MKNLDFNNGYNWKKKRIRESNRLYCYYYSWGACTSIVKGDFIILTKKIV